MYSDIYSYYYSDNDSEYDFDDIYNCYNLYSKYDLVFPINDNIFKPDYTDIENVKNKFSTNVNNNKMKFPAPVDNNNKTKKTKINFISRIKKLLFY